MATTDETLAAAVSTFEEMLFNKFDRLHSHDIHDTEVIRFLRAEGHTLLATRYIEWSGALDPDAEDDNTTMNPVVPDPADTPSYDALNTSLVVSALTALIIEDLKVQREEGDVYFRDDDPTDATIDGHVDITSIAVRIAKRLKVTA